MNERLLYWVWITELFGFSSTKMAPVYYKFSPEEVYHATLDELAGAGICEETAQLLQNKSLDRAKKILDRCEKLGIKIITSNSPYYPRALERLSDKPYVLYVKGDVRVLKKKCASVVGTRRMTLKGESLASDTSEKLIDEGFVLISGGADGIDSVGARVSLDKGKPFVIVSGVDIDKYYPASNKALIDKVAEKGAVISEYPPDTGARYFATRNRLIAGLSDRVYVIEAPEESGALITAEYAKRLRIRIYASDAEGRSFEGCRNLLKEGALPLGGVKMKKEKKKRKPDLSGTRLYIYDKLSETPLSEEELIDENHNITEILTALTELELDGLIKPLPGGKYKLS
ncbi:MAG: DNA-protecting protein DprA [Clostridia bacterium]|nr:DNA-protecting protein DprA [Clostridia bacterium]